MGVVIGETAEVGENVTIYQGVTLGGTRLEKVKRHPTIGIYVVIGSGAKVLGPFTVGNNSRIGSGSVVVKAVPDKCMVVGVPGQVIYRDGKKVERGIDLDMTDLPDPVARAFQCLVDRIGVLERVIEEFRRLVPPASFVPSVKSTPTSVAPRVTLEGRVRGWSEEMGCRDSG
jgi:serine O-acetyltransferase